ncbi:MAG: class I SAM-dependent methyltransferase [Actinomycetaceae bacterium]|nr:class I SAM-dependent methyltransferase [Actinomycetaceae bacterium]
MKQTPPPPGAGLRQPWDPDAPRNAFERATDEYTKVRPTYPDGAIDTIIGDAGGPAVTVADIGAGTGKLTAQLLGRGAKVIAVEPAPAMVKQLRQTLRNGGIATAAVGGATTAPGGGAAEAAGTEDESPHSATQFTQLCQRGDATVLVQNRCLLVTASAEATTLPDNCADVAAYAQCWHWLDPEKTSAEAARILRRGGRIAIVANQMDVEVPWVHRLTRIMRSGDVYRAEKPPRLGSQFGPVTLRQDAFTTPLLPREVMALARTRSSYLRSKPQNQEKMQANLAWYLRDYLGYGEEDVVEIPYLTFTWTAHLI